MVCTESFIECTSLNFSYDIFGTVTISYTMVHSNPDFCFDTELHAGGVSFRGYISNMTMKPITGTVGWYETNVVLTAEGD